MSNSGFGQGAFVGFAVTLAVVMAASEMAPDADDTEQTQPAPVEVPATRTVTNTVTETVEVEVEVPVPTWTDDCARFADLMDSTVQQIREYETGIAPQQQVVYDALGSIIMKDTNGINDAISQQTEIQNVTAGPLQAIIGNRPRLEEARADCLATLEDK